MPTMKAYSVFETICVVPFSTKKSDQASIAANSCVAAVFCIGKSPLYFATTGAPWSSKCLSNWMNEFSQPKKAGVRWKKCIIRNVMWARESQSDCEQWETRCSVGKLLPMDLTRLCNTTWFTVNHFYTNRAVNNYVACGIHPHREDRKCYPGRVWQ